ncbi:glutaredoxin family protein [Endozoicomonas sp. 8E]|uniref:glutaredoxin family protein n=1 Tax=Endozoicomonas sp. 8E TaxID=3035692 RepID=UPI0029390233|nr:glutaredoxin family protein [Endozoicomonas sp. 8E]WOG25368.1 glutaredoxin family protein [Endozoicomonas sp. 8E]
MLHLSFYTTSGCHLCDHVEEFLIILGQHPQLHSQFCWSAVEISVSDDLIEQYGVRIPVIATEEGDEIGWPFEMEQLGEWIYNHLTEHSSRS